MTREQAADFIRHNAGDYLKPAKKRGTYICPICKNGTGKTGDGMTTPDGGIHFTCWKCHEIENADIIDIIGLEYGIDDYKAKFDKAYELYNITIDAPERQQDKGDNMAAGTTETRTQGLYFDNIVDEAHKALLDSKEALSYLTGRGLDLDTIKRFKIGYSAQGHNALLKDYPDKQTGIKKHSLYKYVFPYNDGRGHYKYFKTEICDRAQLDDYTPKYMNLKDVPMPLYNEHYLYQKAAGIIFICEGIYDALSVEVAGHKAIGGIGTGTSKLLEICDSHKDNDYFFVIALDNDGAGTQATQRFIKGLKERGIGYIIRPAAVGKDYNEHLQQDRDGFISFIGKTYKEAYKAKLGAGTMADLEKEIAESSKEAAISTGFSALDNIIDDGIRKGLYVIGAISSLGKTAFTLQVADQIAKQGTDVLFFSLEMSAAEIMARSISRESFDISLVDTGDTKQAKTTLGVLNGRRQANYTEDEKRTLEKAKKAYSAYADNIYIIEGIGSTTVKDIADKAQEHFTFTGKRPVIVVDYLQILQPYPEEKANTDKQVIDRNILELKRLSRSYAVIVVSSFNRASYDEPVTLSSFKESGAVEYTSDLLIALQYKGMDYQKTEKTSNKTGEKSIVWESSDQHKTRINELMENMKQRANNGQAQDIELKVLKNRNGKRENITLPYYPKFNCYRDAGNYNDLTQPNGQGAQGIINNDAVPFAL